MWPRAVIEATEPIVKRMRKADLKFNKSDERNQFEVTVTRSIVLPKNIFSRIAAQVRDNFISFIPFGLTVPALTCRPVVWAVMVRGLVERHSFGAESALNNKGRYSGSSSLK